MSEYWSATSGTALVFPKEEVRDFFTRYLLETYRKDGVTDRDIDLNRKAKERPRQCILIAKMHLPGLQQ